MDTEENMDFPILFGDFADAHVGDGWDDFSALFKDAFLEAHFKGAGFGPMADQGLSATSNASPLAFRIEESRKEWRMAMLYTLEKSDRNRVEGRVTIGRAPVNDVVIPHGSVSKIHAFFRKDPGTGYYSLYDAGSRFGTEVNQTKLREGEGIAMESGAAIVLAQSVHLVFFTPRDFYSYMRLKLRTGKTTRMEKPGAGPRPPGQA
jgi:hypothetical protein